MRKTLEVLQDKPLEDIKMLVEGWPSQVVDEYFEEEFASNGTAVLKTIKVPGSPNGLPYGEQYFEQSRGDIEAYREYQEAQKNRTILELNQEKYDNWVKMTQDAIWFDTGACMSSDYRGKANEMVAQAISQRYRKVTRNITEGADNISDD